MQLSPETANQWNAFAELADWDAAYPLQDERFRLLVIGVHSRGEDVSEPDLEQLARDAGAGPERASYYAAHFEQGRNLLKEYDKIPTE